MDVVKFLCTKLREKSTKILLDDQKNHNNYFLTSQLNSYRSIQNFINIKELEFRITKDVKVL